MYVYVYVYVYVQYLMVHDSVGNYTLPLDHSVLVIWNQGGGGPQLVPSRVSTVWTEETLAGGTPGRECPHDDIGIRPRMGTMRMSEDRVPSLNIESPYGEGCRPSPVLPGAFFR